MYHTVIAMDKNIRRSPRIMAGKRRYLQPAVAVTPDANDSANYKRSLSNASSDPTHSFKKGRGSSHAKRIKAEITVTCTSPQSYEPMIKNKPERPTYEECLYIVKELGKLHPDVLEDCNERKVQLNSCAGQKLIADGIVSTILSQNTTSANSTKAFQNLKKAFPTWEKVVSLPDPPTKLEETIRCGGLAKIKAGRIYKIFKTIQEERGSPCLEYLRDWTDEQIKEELGRFAGLGPKTISCVLLFTMGRQEFPVDTHVHRITKNMRWIPQKATREDAYDYLNARIPPGMKLDLHCLLIAHGKQCHRCAARGKPQFPPKDGTKFVCPLLSISKKAQTGTDAVAKKLVASALDVLVKSEEVLSCK